MFQLALLPHLPFLVARREEGPKEREREREAANPYVRPILINSYNRYLAVASRVVRRSLKEDKRILAERRGESDLRFSKWSVSSKSFFRVREHILQRPTCLIWLELGRLKQERRENKKKKYWLGTKC